MLVAFEVGLQYGCLVVRDTESDGDITQWDPGERSWFVDQGSAIFSVLPAVEGDVRCEVWRGMPTEPLPTRIFREEFEITGALQVEDPNGVVNVELATIRGARTITVLANDGDWASKVQVVIDADGA
jgi:hypothetical protein